MNVFQKQPADQLDYDLIFEDWLTDNDVITGAIAVSSVPAELIVQSVGYTNQIVKVWLAGGVNGETYKVTATITTALGRIKELDCKVRVREI